MVKRRKPLSTGERITDSREPRKPIESRITFSFEYFVDSDGAGQSLRTWAENNCALFVGLLTKMAHIGKINSAQIGQDSTFTLYGRFPPKKQTDFQCPPELESRNWGVIRNIGGQKARVAGFLQNNVFYIVFLDAEHRFWNTNK